MSIDDYKKKKMVKDMIDNPLFKQIVDEIRAEYADMMLSSEEEKVRQSLYSQAKALDKLVGHLTAIANEVRVEDAA